ncbi:MAG: glycosyltransferase family 4 protein [Anaerolineales bacterium]|jgi:glycosyltransferase involved in cell wall biosynthesis
MKPTSFPGKLALQQRVLTAYRAPFFDALAQTCQGGLSVCAGLPRPQESIAVTDQFHFAEFVSVQNRHLLQGSFYLCYQQGLRAWLENCSPDALIVEANPRYLATPAAVRWMKRRGKSVLGWGLGAPPFGGPLSGLRQARRSAFLRPFEALITYSQRGAEEYARLDFPAEKIFVAPNAATGRPSQPMPTRPADFSGQPIVLFVGRLHARKRVDLLLQACAGLPDALRAHLVIVGDGPERDTLKGLAQKVYPAAEFPGAKHGEELAAYFSAADLFVLPGTGGLAVQEAMSYGLPVIMGQGDGTNDQLVRTENGWQIRPDDLSALADSLHTALSDVERLRRMGAESYRIVRDEINLEKMVGVFMEALQSATNK